MKYLILVSFLLIPFLSSAQLNVIPPSNINPTQQEILDIVITLFDGMREGDSSKVHSVFGHEPQLYTSFMNKEGQAILRKDDGLQNFLNAVGTPHDKVWDEPIWNIKINIDDNLASLWTDYAFYAGKNFSHCGVDAFMLNKTTAGWKIFHLTDTRRKKNCIMPVEIKEDRE
jgi:hypothetical protein